MILKDGRLTFNMKTSDTETIRHQVSDADLHTIANKIVALQQRHNWYIQNHGTTPFPTEFSERAQTIIIITRILGGKQMLKQIVEDAMDQIKAFDLADQASWSNRNHKSERGSILGPYESLYLIDNR